MPALPSSFPSSISPSQHRRQMQRAALTSHPLVRHRSPCVYEVILQSGFERKGGRAEENNERGRRNECAERGRDRESLLFASERASERTRALILRQYKLLIMRPAFMCLLIGPPRLLGKIDRSHDRPSLTPNALRARQGSI